MTSSRFAFASLVIVAAGRNERYGEPCKVLELVGGRPVLEWSMLAAVSCPAIAEIIIVVGEHSQRAIADLVESTSWSLPVRLARGGTRRQDSVAAGVAMASATFEVVLVHDGARPLASRELFARCAEAALEHGAAIAAIPVSDTLKHVTDMTIRGTVPRDGLWAAQTPQGFRRQVLYDAMRLAHDGQVEYTDEASMLEALGMTVAIVPGSRSNLKLTVQEDLEMIQAVLMIRNDGDGT